MIICIPIDKIIYNQKKELEEKKKEKIKLKQEMKRRKEKKEELFVLFKEEKIYLYPHFYEHLIDSHNIVYPNFEDLFNNLFDKYDYSKLQDIFDEIIFKIKIYDLFIELESRPFSEYKQFIESNSIQGLSKLKRFDYLYDKMGGQKLYNILKAYEYKKNRLFLNKNSNSLHISGIEKILKN